MPTTDQTEPADSAAPAGPGAGGLALVISSLRSGGAERVMTILAGEWARRGREVTLITLDTAESDFHALPPGVRRVALGVMGDATGPVDAVLRNAGRVRALRRALAASGARAAVSFMDVTNVMTLAASAGLGMAVAVSERIDPREMPLGRLWTRLRGLAYPRAGALVMQSERLRPWARGFLPDDRIFTIPNPLAPSGHPPPRQQAAAADGADGRLGGPAAVDGMDTEFDQEATEEQPEGDGGGRVRAREPLLMAMGRLDRQKGHDLLIKAFELAKRSYPVAEPWRLVIFGEGPERAALSGLAARLELNSGDFEMPGRADDPAPWLARAGIFAMPSRFEGFPNALIEAMAAGVCCVAADCPTGPAEIVRDRIDGALVPVEDVPALANALGWLMYDGEARRDMGERARGVADRFAAGPIVDMWDAALARAARG